MTIDQYIAELRKQKKELASTKAVFLAASTAHADAVERIFTAGNATSGQDIGNYNKKDPIYVNPLDAPRGFAPKGKNGKTTFKNGNKHKTRYFESYSDFRANQGRRNDKVNLDLFGDLKSDFENSLVRISNTAFESAIRREDNIDKALGNQSRFNKAIFAASDEERATFTDVLRFELRKIYG